MNHPTSKSPPHSNKFLKLTLTLPRGALGVLGVNLQIFPLNYAYFFSSALGVQVHPLHPLATTMRSRPNFALLTW